MRTTSPLLVALVAVGLGHPLRAQWGTDVVNNAINWELNIGEGEYTGPNDEDDSADPTIKSTLYVNGTNMGEYCETWDCTSPCVAGSSPGWWADEGAPYNSTLSIFGECFESDGADDCVYDFNYDDHYWGGFYTLRDGPMSMPMIYNSSDFRPCQWNPWLASGTTWLLPSTAEFDQRMYLTWRYAAGWGPEAMLDFGTVAMNTTKMDVNSNVPVDGQASAVGLQYSNVTGSAAADVYYKFHIDQPGTVTISTDDGLTDFDTELWLYSLPGGELIASDDQGGNLPNTSTMVTQLCAGDYQVRVTGWNAYAGLFRLSVTVQAPDPLSVSVVDNSGTSCPDANDGVVSWTASGGIGSLHYLINSSDVGSATTIGDFGVGSHTITAVDACGMNATTTVEVVSMDNVPPNALCEAAISIEVIQGQNTAITVADVDNGSSDNCGPVVLGISPVAFSVGDVGIQDITLTATDGSGNTSTCTCAGLVQNVTGIDEAAIAARIRVVPNPSNGPFRIDLSEMRLSRETRLTVMDPLGRTVHMEGPRRSLMDLDLGHLPNGSYMLHVNDPQWDATKRIVIQH